ncbi:hypothetical protein AZK53_05335 [Priestia megaterium]|uniref:murein biosynthesis integral membrane protein MurJ n=1 Tax=Priestia megaterium TaxID=1404 RepID=UPI0007CDE8ED|nr:lipid II flippase MurJ [Priestia megaterium]ANF45120.1 hypothetical protein AZK53_05335 [Priestia megaterium]
MKKAVVSGAIMLFIGSLLSSVLGIVREIVIAFKFGAGKDLDMLLLAQTVPNTITSFMYVLLTAVFMPMFIRKYEKTKIEGGKVFQSTLGIILIASLIILFIGIFGGRYFFSIKYGEKSVFINNLSTLYFLGAVFFILSALFNLTLNSLNRFALSSMLPLISNIVAILFIVFFSHSFGIYSIATGYLLGLIIQIIVLRYALKKLSFSFIPKLFNQKEILKQFLILSIPVMSITLVDQFTNIVSRFYAAGLTTGSLSALNYANRLIMLVVTLFGTSLIGASYPTFNSFVSKKDYNGLHELILTNIKIVTIIITPLTMILCYFSKDIIQLLFERGAFDNKDTIMTASSLTFYSVGIIFLVIKDLFNKVFFSLSMYNVPLQSALIFFGVLLLSCKLLINHLDYNAIAIATSVGALFCCLFLMFNYVKKIKIRIKIYSIANFAVKIISTAFFTVFSFNFIYRKIEVSSDPNFNTIILIVSILLNLVLYFYIIKLLQIKEVIILINLLMRKFVKKGSK